MSFSTRFHVYRRLRAVLRLLSRRPRPRLCRRCSLRLRALGSRHSVGGPRVRRGTPLVGGPGRRPRRRGAAPPNARPRRAGRGGWVPPARTIALATSWPMRRCGRFWPGTSGDRPPSWSSSTGRGASRSYATRAVRFSLSRSHDLALCAVGRGRSASTSSGSTGTRSRSGSACVSEGPVGTGRSSGEESSRGVLPRLDAYGGLRQGCRDVGDLGVARLDTFLTGPSRTPPVVPASAGQPLALPRSHRVGGVRRRPGAFGGDNGANHLVDGSGKRTTRVRGSAREHDSGLSLAADGGCAMTTIQDRQLNEPSARASSSTRPACRTWSPPGPGRIRTRWR